MSKGFAPAPNRFESRYVGKEASAFPATIIVNVCFTIRSLKQM